ncbi:hypothetical protein [Paenibacillus sp. GXUN7292]|uniref:hypothetical protein n=1 Tax=Paenibacillus sp. GXUN7292 TaxID=3422499 RepID=UPI003D7E69AF
MKGNVLKTLVLAMALILVLSACGGENSGTKNGNNGSTSSTTTPSSGGSETNKEPESPIEISWLNFYLPGKDTATQKYVEELFNVKITPLGYDRSNWQQQINIMLASGVRPDYIGNTDLTFADFLSYVKQGLIGELPVEKIREYAPNYSAMVDKYDPTAWNVAVVDGKNYGIPRIYGEGGSPFLPAYNKEWLKNIGYDAPPTTLEELEDVLTKFRNNDPDQNGKKDTYGMSVRGKDTLGSNQIFNTVFAAHGIRSSGWHVKEDNTVEHVLVSEQARAVYKLLNKWYKAGLIDPEFITDDANSYRAKFVNGKTGMMDQMMWYHYHTEGAVGADAVKTGLEFAVGAPVIGPAGQMNGIVQGYKQNPYAIGADAVKDEAKVKKILEMVDRIATDKDVYMKVSFGEEGVHYDVVNGGAVRKAEFSDIAKSVSTVGTTFFKAADNPDMLVYEYSAEKQAYKEELNKSEINILYDIMQLVDLPSWTENRDAIDKVLKEFQLKFVAGEVDLDAGFDSYVAELNKIGLAKATEEANAAYARNNK